MGFYTILKNEKIDIQLVPDYQDNGWSFLNGMAVHSQYNSGSITNKVFRPQLGKYYEIEIQISNLSSGALSVTMGGVEFGNITMNGSFVLTGVTITSSPLMFTTGLNAVNIVSYSINEGSNDGTTLVFDTLNNAYVGEQSIKGEYMDKFLEDFIVFKNGVPWVSDDSSARNTFFGVHYPSIIKFYCNIDYDNDKDFYTVTINGDTPWRVDLTTPPREGKPIGQRSRIKPGNFKFDKGKYVANILRDMNDPRFDNELQALMKGAYIQGQLMEVTITNNSTDEVTLMSVDIDVAVK